MSGFIDGNFANLFLSENIPSYPLADKPGNANTACFELTYYQWANSFVPASVGSTDTNAPLAYLFAQGEPVRVGAGVVKFTRSFAQIPVTWYELEQVQYNYPGLDSNVGTVNYVPFGLRYAVTVQKLATVEHKYVLNTNIPYGNVSNVTIVTLRGQPTNRIGQGSYTDTLQTVPNVDPSIWVLSSDPVRWKGSLWEIVTKTVGYANVFYP